MTNKLLNPFGMTYRLDVSRLVVFDNGDFISTKSTSYPLLGQDIGITSYSRYTEDGFGMDQFDEIHQIYVDPVAGDQIAPSIISLESDRILLSWQDYGSADSDEVTSYSLKGRFYDKSFSPLSGEFLISSQVAGTSRVVDAALSSSGTSVVILLNGDMSGAEDSLSGSVFNPDGSPAGEFSIDTTPTNYLGDVELSIAADDSFTVAWVEATAYAGDMSVRAQRFTSDGMAMGGPVTLPGAGGGLFGASTKICILKNGNYVAVWPEGGYVEPDIKARVFDASGAPLGKEFLVNSVTHGDQDYPAVAALDNGGFVVVWSDNSHAVPDFSATAVRGQTFNADGHPIGSEFVANTTTRGSQFNPSVYAMEGDRFVVFWTDSYPYLSRENGQQFEMSDSRDDYNYKIVGSDSDDEICGNIFNDEIFGEYGDDILVGERGNDVIYGGEGRDRIDGLGGSDVLYGDKGRDVLKGGTGADIFVLRFYGTAGNDSIVDFSPLSDSIELARKTFKKAGKIGILEEKAFVVGKEAQDKSDRIIYDAKKGLLLYDADGSKQGEATIFAHIGKSLDIDHEAFDLIA